MHPGKNKPFLYLLLAISFLTCDQQASRSNSTWPQTSRETKPWTRWWWHGSAVNKADLTDELEALAQAGFGGVEITPIYGVIGEEDKFIDYLSPKWMEMLDYTLQEAERLGLGVDMATGTGWPFGGPNVGAEDAPRNIHYKKYELQGGESLTDTIRFRQQSYLRAVQNQVYQLYGLYRDREQAPTGSLQDPVLNANIKVVSINDLVEPVSANENLQALTLDQVQFAKDLPLQTLMAYSQAGDHIDLTDKVDQFGHLTWQAPAGTWTLYALFSGWHGKMVERAAPGGEGNTIDHFSTSAINNYLARFDGAFRNHDIGSLRAFFNDSYEVDDARGQADWTPNFFDEFINRRGYDLRNHLPELFGEVAPELHSRVLCDYRETVSELIRDNFTANWQAWATQKGAIVRNQAHGSPANILDLYALSDIPETEGTDLLGIKFASSATHVSGKKLASSESATWLNEHFQSTLAEVKQNLERYWLGGINHVVYHGTAYSPKDAEWPGRLFYAAVHFNDRNPFWHDLPALNRYVERTQSFLQSGKPDSDLLLYFPIYDRFSKPDSRGLLTHFGAGEMAGDSSGFKQAAEILHEAGYTFDYVSDKQLQDFQADRHNLISQGGTSYRAIVVPACQFIPLATFSKLVSLAEAGANIIVHKHLPMDVPGLNSHEQRREEFSELTSRLDFVGSEMSAGRQAQIGEGLFFVGNDLGEMISKAGLEPERLVGTGLRFVRRTFEDGKCYFITNWGTTAFDGWLPLSVSAKSVSIFDAMRGTAGTAQTQSGESETTEVYLQLQPGESCVLKTHKSPVNGPAWIYMEPAGAPIKPDGKWQLTAVSGGPELPDKSETADLISWTELDEKFKSFSGTVKYQISFSAPSGEGIGWWLDLGKVAESALVKLNGTELGTLIGPTFRLFVDKDSILTENVLEIDISNLMANRIADLDKRKVLWKQFYNINFPARRGENRGADNLFTAENWRPRPSGLFGPVTLTPVKSKTF